MDYKMSYLELIDTIYMRCSMHNFNLNILKNILELYNILDEDLHNILDLLCKKGNYSCVKYMIENVIEEDKIEYVRLLFNTCHNEKEDSNNLILFKYLINKYKEKIPYNNLFPITCAYDLNMVKYIYFNKKNKFTEDAILEAFTNSLYNLTIHPNNYLIIKFLIGIENELVSKLTDYEYLNKICDYFKKISHSENITENKLFKYLLKIIPNFTYEIKNYFKYFETNEKIINDINEYEIKILKNIQGKFLKKLYSPYSEIGIKYFEKKINELYI